MRIGFVGAGKVGTAFGQYLKQHEYEIAGYHDVKEDTAVLAATALEGENYSTPWEAASQCDILFITTPDDQIESVSKAINARGGFRKGQWVGHMSGACSSEVLDAARRQGAVVFSLHPIQAFADPKEALGKLPQTFFSLEGNPDELEIIRQVMERCGNLFIEMTAEQKPLYHAGACVISNYMVALIDYALQYYDKIGIPVQDAQHFLWPLVTGTLENIQALGTEKALTGPISRGDCGTVRKHIDVLSVIGSDLLSLYEELGKWTVHLALRKGTINQEQEEALMKLLQDK